MEIPKLSNTWRCSTAGYSLSGKDFAEIVDSITKELEQRERAGPVAVLGSDPLLVLVGMMVSFRTRMSIEIVADPARTSSSSATRIVQTGGTGDWKKDFRIEASDGHSPPWEAAEPCVSILYPEEIRVVYPLHELWNAIESFLAFTGLRTERGIMVMGSLCREFGFFAAASALVSGVPLALVDNLEGLGRSPPILVSALFLGRDVSGDSQENALNSCRKFLRPLRRSFSFVGVEGPARPEFTMGLEKASEVPVLQMYGISGRGVVLSNPKEFNVHGSAGIPITNVEAIIADNYEGNWTRDRILIGPGMEGELVVKSPFVDGTKDVGDPRQNPVKTSIRGLSTDWVTTGIMGKMDENGYFYLKDASFR